MKRLQRSTWGKLLAVVLMLSCAAGAAVFGGEVLLSLPYVTAASWQDTPQFTRLIQAREGKVAEMAACYLNLLQADAEGTFYTTTQQYQAELETLEEEMSASATWFRYVLRGPSGEYLTSNLGVETLADYGYDVDSGSPEELSWVLTEILGTNMQYATFTAGEYYVEHGGTWSQSYSVPGSWSLYESTADTYEADENTLVVEGTPTLVIAYSVAEEIDGSIYDEFYQLSVDYATYYGGFSTAINSMLSLAVLSVLALCYLLWTAGHKAGEEGIVLTWQEKIFFDLYLPVIAAAEFGLAQLGTELGYFLTHLPYSYSYYAEYQDVVQRAALPAVAAAGMGAAALVLRTLAVRLKARCLARTTLLCRVAAWMAGTIHDFVKSLPFTWKAVCGFIVYFLLNLWLMSEARYNDLFQFLCFLVNGVIMVLLAWWAMGFYRLRKGTKTIASGDLEHQIDTRRMPYDLRLQAEELNNISVGLAGAVEEKMKSERFKAELITNVSHDLKTPLTSIINYVNLLKSTEQTDPKALEYIEVLDRKSQRLKKLTEDLVEASKASTGVLSVNREKIGMCQLIDQALGEWAEKLEDRRLTVVSTLPEGETWVYADGRHLWRVIDNLLSNCAKYAMEGTRVYLDLVRGHGQVMLSVKNISRDALNVPPEQLMERFVRGEESRTTEGSGLGLSIARSLTELQGGEFQLAVDGDLFKAMVTLPQAN